MASKKKAAKAGAGAAAAAKAVRSNQYVQRVMDDPELRDNLRNAFESARKAYGRMQNGKGPVKAVPASHSLRARACERRSLTLCSARRRSSSTRRAPLPNRVRANRWDPPPPNSTKGAHGRPFRLPFALLAPG